MDGSNYIKASKLGISNGDIMLAGSTKNITLKVKYNGEAQSSEQTGTVTLNFNFTRLKGGVGQVTPEVYDAYEIGDKVTFAGSDWYVIEDSPTSQDYVILMRKKILNAEEIGESYSSKVNNKAQPYMAYYWSSTCHRTGTYGTDTYNDTNESGCREHNDYEGSKIKQAIEGYMNTYLDSSELKEIAGYKIRLVTLGELQNNLGVSKELDSNAYKINSQDTPAWVYIYSYYNGYGYWTMSSASGSNVWNVYSNGQVAKVSVLILQYNSTNTVRPVINLYKDAIE